MIVSRSQKNERGRKCGRKRLQYTWGVRMGMVVDGWVVFFDRYVCGGEEMCSY